MVKGISKQVIVVHSPDRKLFDQAIFILSDEALKGNGVTDDMLLREAKRLIKSPERANKTNPLFQNLLLTSLGALLTGAVWLLTTLL